jgi:mono/diheme cytochrome c family protein
LQGEIRVKRFVLLSATLAVATFATGHAFAQQVAGKKLSEEAERGRYLVQIAGCNDCHTRGYAGSGGKVDESLWLTGDDLGWRGPWGTTYASNLRLVVKDMTAGQFVKLARSPLRPPMPWFNLRDMRDRDVKAIYAYLKHLGPAGKPAPSFVPPDKKTKGPYVQFPAPPK